MFDAHGGFYFTDHGKSNEVGAEHGRLFYGKADGSSITQIAADMNGTNGIGISPDGTRLYVSETYTARVWWWEITAPGEIVGGQTLAGSSGGNFLRGSSDFRYFDSLGVEANGNICWGGPDMRTAFVTASSTGKLLRFDWPRAGLVLNYQDA